MSTASHAIAKWAVGIKQNSLADTDIYLARRALADTIGVAFADRREEASRLVLRYALEEGSRQDYLIWATGDRVSDELAALANRSNGSCP